MDKITALAALEQGHKITHKWFSDNEYVHKVSGRLQDENGNILNSREFWQLRGNSSWETDWSIYQES